MSTTHLLGSTEGMITMNTKEQRIKEIKPDIRKPLTQRITLAVIDAAQKGLLDPTLSKRIIDYVDEPYAHSYGEPKYSLHDRFIKDTTQLFTKSGLLNMLHIVEMAGGYVSRTHYGCLAPKGVSYKDIKNSDVMSIMTQVATYKEMLELEELYSTPSSGIVLESDDYYWEEHESYKEVI